jgi:hypothetical protein
MYTTYEDAAEATISRQQAIREVKKHHSNVEEFFAEVGEKAEYSGKEVLDWLGY